MFPDLASRRAPARFVVPRYPPLCDCDFCLEEGFFELAVFEDREFPFVEFAFEGLLPTLALTLAFKEPLPAALWALLAAVFAIDCVVEAALLTAVVAPLVSLPPDAEPLAVSEPPLALALPLPEPLAAFDAPWAVLEADDCAVFAVPFAVFFVDEVSAFP